MLKRLGGLLTTAAIIFTAVAGNIVNVSAYDENDRPKTPRDAYLQGIEFHDGNNRARYIDDTDIFYRQNKMSMMSTWYDTAMDTLEWMQLAKIFITHTHGDQVSFALRNVQNKETNLSIGMIDSLPAKALSRLNLSLFGTCSAGKGGSGAQNLVNATANKGAKVVIGFMDTTRVDQINQYLYDFTKSLLKEKKTYKQSMADGLYWTKFWGLGNAGGTDKPYTRGDLNKTYQQYK